MAAPNSFAGTLQRARQKKKLTMRAVSERTRIALPLYRLIETGRLVPDQDKLDALCTALGIVWSDDDNGTCVT